MDDFSCPELIWAARRFAGAFCDRPGPGRHIPICRGRRAARPLGLSRSALPCAQHGGPTRQSLRRTLSLHRSDCAAASRPAPLAREEDRPAQVLAPRCEAASPAATLLRERHSTRSFDTRDRSRLEELSRSWIVRRGCKRSGAALSTMAAAVPWWNMPPGPTRRPAPVTNSSSTSRWHQCEGLGREASTTTTPPDTRSFRSASGRRTSRRR